MAKRKVSLDKEGMQQFFMLHGEKVGMVVVLGLMGYFIYSGMNVEGLDDSKNPANLIQIADSKRSQVDGSDFESFSAVRTAKTNLLEEVEAGAVMDPTAFIVSDLNEPPMKPKTLRNDPELRVATDPHVVGMFAAVALNGGDGHEEDILSLPFAPDPEDSGRPSRRDDPDSGLGAPAFPGGSGFPGSFPGSSSMASSR